MEKINFEAGTIVTPAKVNEDKTITPAVWEGKTPLSPFMLNKLQENIENDQIEQNTIIDELKAKTIKCLQEVETPTPVSGTSIDINDSAEAKITELKISGNSKQETRSGKNKFIPLPTGSNSGVAITLNMDGTYNLEGTAVNNSENINHIDIEKSGIKEGLTYILSATKDLPEGVLVRAEIYNGTTWVRQFVPSISSTNKTSTGIANFTNATRIRFLVLINSGITVNIKNIGFQLEEGTIATDYEQYGVSPSPDYPSEVESCGDNVNLFDKDNANILDNAFLNTTDKIITSFTGRKSFYIKIKPNTTYTISRKIIASVFSAGTTEDIPTVNSTLIDVAYNNNGKEMTIITSSNAKYLTIYYKRDIDTSTDEEILDSIKIQKGTTPTPYSPYGQGCINEVVCNKNFINVFSRFVTGYTETVNGVTFTINKDRTVKVNGTNTTDSWTYFLLSTESTAGYDKNSFVDENTYYLAGAPTNSSSSTYRLQFYDASINKSIYDYGSGVSVKRTASAGWNIAIGVASGVTVNNLVFKPMLLKGNYTGKTLPDYEAHKEQTYTIPTQQPFRGNGDTRDTFIKKNNKWYERHYINRLILNGTESWQISTDTKFFFVTNIISSTDYSKVYCNIALSASSYAELTDGTARAAVRNSGNGIYISNKNNMTLEGWKAWLVEQYNAGGPVYIDYPSITPLDIECTEEQSTILWDIEQNAKTYKNITHMYSTDEISPVIEVTYKKDIEKLFANALVESGV